MWEGGRERGREGEREVCERQEPLAPINKLMTQSQQTVLITGANRGLGFALATAFKLQNYKVIATVRKLNTSGKLTPIEEVADKIYALDMSHPETIPTFVHQLIDVDNVNVDLIINNAGILYKIPEAESALNTLNHEMTVNAISPFLLTRDLLAAQSKKDSRTLKCVLIGSMLGSTANNDCKTNPGMHGYRASKAAAHSLFKSLSQTHLDSMKVLMVHPGHVKTDMGGDLGKISVEESIENILAVFTKFEAGSIESGSLIDSGTGLHLAF